jgi:hypothetical protein
VGVHSPQGTDSGPWAHPGRGCELTGGGNILSTRNLSESLYVEILKQWCNMADMWRPTIRADVATLMKSSCTTVLRGPLLLSGSHGAQGNHDHDPRPTGRRAYGMRGDSVSAPLHHHFTVQCRLMSGTCARLSASGYAERVVRARSAAPDGLPLVGEDKQGLEPSVWIHIPILLPFAPISFIFCTFSFTIFGHRPPPWPLSSLPRGSRR